MRLLAAVVLLAAASLGAACGSGSGSGPSSTNNLPRVTAVTPNTGSTLGGTAVTISGSNFATGATVTIGGAAARDVAVVSGNAITATTPQHAEGPAEVVVTVGSDRGSLPGGFTFVAPSPITNTPPVITSIAAAGTRPKQPAQFADLGESLTVAVTVQDAETPMSQMTYEWSSPLGTFTGTGATVTWRAPAQVQVPASATLTVVVTEKYQGTNASGLPATLEHKVTGTTVVKIHDSVKEIGDLAVQFLKDFSDSTITDADFVVRNFASSCPGKDAERQDVVNNRKTYRIQSSNLGAPSVTVNFGGVCSFRSRKGDACAYMTAEWRALIIDPANPNYNKIEIARGTDQMTAVYEGSRWWLCDSDFDGSSTTGLRFKR